MSDRGDGFIYRRGKTYWCCYYVGGTRHRESCKTDDEKRARRYLKETRVRVKDGTVPTPMARARTVREILDEAVQRARVEKLRSVRRIEQANARLLAAWGKQRAAGVTPKALLDYVERRRERDGAADATIVYELRILSRAYTLAKLTPPEMPDIEVENARQGFFEFEDFARVRDELAEPALKAVVTFAYLTGWRRGEILSLTWEDVDTVRQHIRLPRTRTKGKDDRTFPYRDYAPLAQLLQDQRDYTRMFEEALGRPVPYVFHRQGSPIGEFRKSWSSACKRAGIPGRLVHDFRRSAVRNLERGNVPRSVAMRLTGHKTESVYLRYAIVSEADLTPAVAKLGAQFEADRHNSATRSGLG